MRYLITFSISIFTLTLYAQENDYNVWQLLPDQYDSLTHEYSEQQTMCYVIQTNGSSPSTIVIDGGLDSLYANGTAAYNATYLKNFLSLIGRTHVDAWIITHSHVDHLQALTKILQNPDDISIDTIYYSFPCTYDITNESTRTDYLDSCSIAGIDDCKECWLYRQDLFELSINSIDDIQKGVLYSTYKPFIQALISSNVNSRELNYNEDISIDNILIHILKVCNPDLDYQSYNEGVNNQSVVFTVEIYNGKKVLFLGDLGNKGATQLKNSGQDLHANYVQMAHHGNGAMQNDEPNFYSNVKPLSGPFFGLWPTPQKIYKYYSGAIADRNEMNQLGVSHNYVSGYEGLVLIPGCLPGDFGTVGFEGTYNFNTTSPHLVLARDIWNSDQVLINDAASAYLIAQNSITLTATSWKSFQANYKSTFRAQIVPECAPSPAPMQSQKKKLIIPSPENDRINVYPNPADESIQISFNLKDDVINNVSLYSVRGDKLRETDWFKISEGVKSMNVSDIPGGVYILRIYTGGEIITRKIIVK